MQERYVRLEAVLVFFPEITLPLFVLFWDNAGDVELDHF